MTDAAHGGEIVAYCDGGSRGNPGPSGYGVSVEDAAGHPIAGLSEFLGVKTNNFAEYSGLLAALEYALTHGHPRLRVVADSELMVKQMKGQYRVASPVLRPLYDEARRLSAKLERFEMRHTLRGGNKEADQLANEAMDKGMGRTPSSQSAEAFSRRVSDAPLKPAPARPAPQVLEGYVKGGVVHLLEGELPDGIFVKVVRE
jgi:ribonuclease HI